MRGYSAAPGTHSLTAIGYDVAGNSTTVIRTYTIMSPMTLKGFYQPVDMGGVWNTVKGGATVPFEFELFDGASEVTNTAAVESFAAALVSCASGAAIEDPIEFTTTGGTSLRYDATGGQFVQNWQTPKKPGTCYRVTLTTIDNTALLTMFKIK